MVPAAWRASISAPVQKPARVGRSWVVEETSACGRVFVVAAHGAVRVLFEIEQAVAEDAEAGQGLADVGLHGAQVFADDDDAVADAFERQDADEIVSEVSQT